MRSAAVLPFARSIGIPRDPLIQTRPSADRRSVINYPGGHVVRIDRAHLERVLAVKAGLAERDDG